MRTLISNRALQRRIFRTANIFPSFVVLVALILVTLKISGTSLGMYGVILGEEKDSSLILGHPQPIRSDEWLVISSKTISQKYNNYQKVNPDIGYGEDVSVMPDIPTRDWGGLFKPENLSFLFLPFDNAFAFKWWFGLVLLIIAAYYFSRIFFTKNILAAALLSIFLGFAPLIQWTYRGFLLLPIAYGFLIVILAYNITDKNNLAILKKRQKLIWFVIKIALLAYLSVAFFLVLYPPFQIVVALIMGGFYIDRIYARSRPDKQSIKSLLKSQAFLLPALFISLVTISLFIVSHGSTIEAIKDTKHPGSRSYETGYFLDSSRLKNLWAGSYAPQILGKTPQLDKSNYFASTKTGNQSEAAGFAWFLPLLILLLLVVYKYTKQKQPVFIIGTSVGLLIILFYPNLSLPILEQVPPARWSLGIGLVSFLLFGLLFDKLKILSKKQINANKAIFIICSAFLLIGLASLHSLSESFPALLSKKDLIVPFMILVVPLLAFIFKKPLISLAFISLTTFLITITINPVYRGTGVALNNDLVEDISKIDKNNPGVWIVATEGITLESLPLLAGAQTITTNYSYPQSFWKNIDKNGNDFAYNRAAHVEGKVTSGTSSVQLKQVNIIDLKINPCEKNVVDSLKIKYLLVSKELDSQFNNCVSLISSPISGKQSRYYIYETK